MESGFDFVETKLKKPLMDKAFTSSRDTKYKVIIQIPFLVSSITIYTDY